MTDFFLAKAPRKFSVESMFFSKWCWKKWVAVSKKKIIIIIITGHYIKNQLKTDYR